MNIGSIIGWLKGLSTAGKVAVGVVSVGAVGAVASPPPPDTAQDTKPAITQSVEKTKPAKPVVTTKTVTETKRVPYKKTTVKDSGLAKGKTRVVTAGVSGRKIITYKVTFTDGKETARAVVSEKLAKKPVNQVIAVGTYVYVAPPKPKSNCDPNYSGCVPVASDVDCAGGSGNGPAYTSGPVRVIGVDIYDLDRDGDGYGCDS